MRFLFTVLLLVFSSISAFITYLYTSSLATSASTLVAMASLGLAFDTLKCLLPAAALEYLDQRRYAYAGLCGLVCLLLVAFSFYASFHLFDMTAAEKGKGSTAYELKQKQIAALEQQRDILFKHDMASRATPTLEKIAVLQQELLAMDAPKTVGKNVELIANLVLSVLLELSVFACHIAMRLRAKNSSSKQAQKSSQKSASSLARTGLDDAIKSSKSTSKSAYSSLSIDELSQIILQRGDADLTYRQLENKYSISSNRVREVKQFLQELERDGQTGGLVLVQ